MIWFERGNYTYFFYNYLNSFNNLHKIRSLRLQLYSGKFSHSKPTSHLFRKFSPMLTTCSISVMSLVKLIFSCHTDSSNNNLSILSPPTLLHPLLESYYFICIKIHQFNGGICGCCIHLQFMQRYLFLIKPHRFSSRSCSSFSLLLKTSESFCWCVCYVKCLYRRYAGL